MEKISVEYLHGIDMFLNVPTLLNIFTVGTISRKKIFSQIVSLIFVYWRNAFLSNQLLFPALMCLALMIDFIE